MTEVQEVHGIECSSAPSLPMSVVPAAFSTEALLRNSAVLKVAWLTRWKMAPMTASGVPRPAASTM